jgi:hypothetical protein
MVATATRTRPAVLQQLASSSSPIDASPMSNDTQGRKSPLPPLHHKPNMDMDEDFILDEYGAPNSLVFFQDDTARWNETKGKRR